MMFDIKNQPAFPLAYDDGNANFGMSIRDYFAAKAMQAMVTDPSWKGLISNSVAAMAYEVADAMIAERAK